MRDSACVTREREREGVKDGDREKKGELKWLKHPF